MININRIEQLKLSEAISTSMRFLNRLEQAKAPEFLVTAIQNNLCKILLIIERQDRADDTTVRTVLNICHEIEGCYFSYVHQKAYNLRINQDDNRSRLAELFSKQDEINKLAEDY